MVHLQREAMTGAPVTPYLGFRSSRVGSSSPPTMLSSARVAQTEGDKSDDIFDGLAVESGDPAQLRFVPGEIVGQILPGKVTLKIGSADLGTLEPFQPPPPEAKWVPGKVPLSTRLSNWLRGKR